MLKTASCQNERTIEEFYRSLAQSDEPFRAAAGAAMADLLPELAEACRSLDAWALTSLDLLCLLAEDDYQTPAFVVVSAGGEGQYYVRYRMHSTEAPWPDAYVTGQAPSKGIALEMIRSAMHRSRGWP
jgi:hypothetical protein